MVSDLVRDILLFALCAGAAAAGCAGQPTRPATVSPSRATGLISNVTREDYVGSAACAECHPDVTAAWARSPMHRMTRDARGAEVRAPFDGTRWRFKNDVVTLERTGDERFMRIEPAEGRPQTYRVTRVIGGREREDFAGVEVDGAQGDWPERPREELVLPVSFVFATGAFRYKGYSVMVRERETLRPGPVWRQTCIFCHNTIPEMDRLLGAIAGPGPHGYAHYQGETVDQWLPIERRARVRITDPDGLVGALRGEIERLGGRPPAGDADAIGTARATIDVVRARFGASSLVELGIGCEACHGGGREHVRDPRIAPSLAPTAPWLDVTLPATGHAQSVNRACARCHQVLFSRYPFTWEGGRRDAAPGGSHIHSGEGRDFLLGSCAGAMSCTACHDPHGGRDGDTMRALATARGNDTCTGCHAGLRDRDRLSAHAHHDPDGAGAACVSCHMPRKNMGLGGRLTSYHRIGSPTDAERVLGDRPIECALCHADKTVRALVDSMERWWPVRYPRRRLEQLYGSLDANAMRATLELGKPHERAVAIATLGELRSLDAAPLIARELTGPFPLVREWARRALTDILGRCDVDLSADDATIARQAVACGAAGRAPPSATGGDEEPED